MKKFNIVNNNTQQAIYKNKSGRHYRKPIGYPMGLTLISTTKSRAEKEAKFLNENYYSGWEIKEVPHELP